MGLAAAWLDLGGRRHSQLIALARVCVGLGLGGRLHAPEDGRRDNGERDSECGADEGGDVQPLREGVAGATEQRGVEVVGEARG